MLKAGKTRALTSKILLQSQRQRSPKLPFMILRLENVLKRKWWKVFVTCSHTWYCVSETLEFMSINNLYGRSLVLVRLSAEYIHLSGHPDQYLNCFHFWFFQKAQKERIDRSINATDSGHAPALGVMSTLMKPRPFVPNVRTERP